MNRSRFEIPSAGVVNERDPRVAGILPVRKNTVTAEVLMRLLCRERLTSLDAVNEASTTRLAAVVYSLEKNHGWNIKRDYKAVGCRDGRLTFVCEYWLDDAAIACAVRAGSGYWNYQVRAARAARRAHAPDAYKLADEVNEYSLRWPSTAQLAHPGPTVGSHG